MLRKIRYKTILKLIKILTPKFYYLLTEASKKGYIQLTDYDLVNRVPRNSILEIKKRVNDTFGLFGLEIGVKKGYNSQSILDTLNMKLLYLVDSWSNYDDIDCIYDDIDENYQIVFDKFKDSNNVIIEKMLSSQFVKNLNDNSLDFVYIDGNHYYDYCLQDLKLYYPKVKNGGFICGHDLGLDNVKFAVYDFCKEMNLKFEFLYPDFLIEKKK